MENLVTLKRNPKKSIFMMERTIQKIFDEILNLKAFLQKNIVFFY